jgi:prophage DNA circulation protein
MVVLSTSSCRPCSAAGQGTEMARPNYKLKSWRDNLMDASFRGIPFKVEAHEFSCGRWVDVEEKVNPNGPSWIWITDKGGEAEYFDIDAYIIQNSANGYDYFKNRDDLIKAVSIGRNMDNSGTLVHPYLGIKKAFAVGDQKFSESVTDGGMCKIKLRFVWDTRQDVKPVVMANPSVADMAALNAKNNALDKIGRAHV